MPQQVRRLTVRTNAFVIGLSKALLIALLAIRVDAQTSQSRASGLNIPAATRAVVRIRAYDSRGAVLGEGSGFVLEDGRVATNRHVVAGATQIEVHDSQGALLASFGDLTQLSYSVDLAITPRLPNPPGRMRIGSQTPNVGDRIVVIGAPLGLPNTVSDGIVSALRTSGDTHFLQMTAPVSHGSSGGPVLNALGEVVGVTTLQLSEGQNINFAVPSSELLSLYLSPPGRFAFPAQERAEQDSAATANTQPPETLRGLVASLPPEPAAELTDNDFRLDLFGCFGDKRKSVIVCALRFHPISTGTQKVNIYEANLRALAGGSANVDMGYDTKRTYPIKGDNDWMPVESSDDAIVLLRFVTPYASDAQVRLTLRVGGPFVKRNQTFAPVRITAIDSNLDNLKWLFGS